MLVLKRKKASVSPFFQCKGDSLSSVFKRQTEPVSSVFRRKTDSVSSFSIRNKALVLNFLSVKILCDPDRKWPRSAIQTKLLRLKTKHFPTRKRGKMFENGCFGVLVVHFKEMNMFVLRQSMHILEPLFQ